MTAAESLQRSVSPTEVAQKWARVPLTEQISPWSPVDAKGNKSVVGEMLTVALDPTFWIQQLDHETATILAARSLGISRLHVDLVERVVNDFVVNRRYRSGELNEIATSALLHPEMYLGPQTPLILTFGRLLDSYTPTQLHHIHSHAPGSWEDKFDKARKRANEAYKEPDYTFGYHSGQEAARLALICAGVVLKAPGIGRLCETGYQPERPTKIDLNNVDELVGLAVNEIQTFGKTSGRTSLYFLSRFFNDRGQSLTLNWLRKHSV